MSLAMLRAWVRELASDLPPGQLSELCEPDLPALARRRAPVHCALFLVADAEGLLSVFTKWPRRDPAGAALQVVRVTLAGRVSAERRARATALAVGPAPVEVVDAPHDGAARLDDDELQRLCAATRVPLSEDDPEYGDRYKERLEQLGALGRERSPRVAAHMLSIAEPGTTLMWLAEHGVIEARPAIDAWVDAADRFGRLPAVLSQAKLDAWTKTSRGRGLVPAPVG